MTDLFERSMNKWNTLLLETSLQTGLNLGRPAYICAKMTMRCNSRCAHCNIWDMEYHEQELTTGQWFRILDQLRDWLGRFHMTFTGGEALLRDDMPSILQHAVGLGIRVELLSNGIMLDEPLATRLAAIGIDRITISYDGVTSEVHDRFRGGDGYHAATRAAIVALNRHRRHATAPLQILLKTVISANNLHEISGIAQWAEENDLNVQYQPIEQNYGEQPDPQWYKGNPLWITDLAALRTALDELHQVKTVGSAIVNNAADFERFYRYFEDPETLMTSIQAHSAKDGKGMCTGMGNFVISSNGDVRMCFRMEPFGNIADTSPREVWRNRKRCWVGACGFR